jgi:hypothetical protein
VAGLGRPGRESEPAPHRDQITARYHAHHARGPACGCRCSLQVTTALDMLACIEARQEVLRHQLLHAARHMAGAKVLAARLYGVGPVTALALTCWPRGAGRFSSSRTAVPVRRAGHHRLVL